MQFAPTRSLRVAAIFLLCFSLSVAQDAPDKNEQSAIIQFSAEMMPIEKIATISGYIPIEREEWDQLIKVLEEPNGNVLTDARIESANYVATFASGSLVKGIGSLSIANPTEEKTVLPLLPCNIPVSNPRSRIAAILAPADATNRVPVGVGPDGQLVAIIEPSTDDTTSELVFDWSLLGDSIASGGSRFQLRLPKSVRNTVEILLKDEFRLSCDQGVVSEEPETLDVNRWTIASGSAGNLTISISPDRKTTSESRGVAIYRQRDRVDILPQGIDGLVGLQLDLYATERESLSLNLDAGVRIKSVQLDDKPLRWTQTTTDQTTIAFRPPLPEGTHRLRIEYTAPAPKANADWELPRIQPQDMIWHSGSALVTVSRPLQLANLRVADCQQVAALDLEADVGGSTARSGGQQMEFEFHRASPSITLRTQPLASRIMAQTGTVITVGSGESTRSATVTTRLDAQSGQSFELHGTIADGWTVEELSTLPEDAIETWNVGDDSRLVVRLAEPLTQSGKLTLRIKAKQTGNAAPDRVRADELRVVTLHDVIAAPQLFAIRGQGNTRLRQASAHDVQAMQLQELSDIEREVIESKRGDLIFRDSPGLNNLRVDVKQGLPAWEADINVTSTLQSEAMLETFSVACRTDGVRPNQIVLQTWPQRDRPLAWMLRGVGRNEDTKLEADLLTEKAKADSGYDPEFDVWVIGLPSSADFGEVEIEGTRQIGLPRGSAAAGVTASVASAPQSTTQRSTTTLIATAATRARWTVQSDLPRVPLPLVANEDRPEVLTSYLVDTSNIRKHTIEMKRESTADPISPGIWITSATTTAELSEAGPAICTGTYNLENLRAQSVTLTFPADSVLRRAMVDGEPVLISEGLRDTELEVTLPSASRYVELVVEYSLDGDPLAPYHHFRWERPVTDVAELTHSLNLLLPNDYLPKGGRRLSSVESHRSDVPFWIDRWFGPLGRKSAGKSVVNEPAVNTPDLESTENVQGMYSASRVWNCPIRDGQANIRLYHRQSANVLGWGAFLIVVTLVQSFRKRVVLVTSVAAVAAIMAGWVGPEWIPLCRGVMFGALLGLAWQMFPARRRTHDDDSILVFRKAHAQTAMLLLCVVVASRMTRGQTNTASDSNSDPRVTHYRVLIEIDEEGNKSKDYVHIPKEMHARLHRLSQSKKPATEQWLATSASYVARLADNEESVATFDRLDGILQLTTYRRGARVALKFSSPIDDSAIQQLRLDGRPVEWRLAEDNQSLLMTVGESGNHTLRLSLDVESTTNKGETEVALPLIASSKAQLKLATDRDDLEPQLIIDDRPPRPLASNRDAVNLSPLQSVRLRWRTSPLRPRSETSTDVRQLGWLSISPGLSKYEVRFAPPSEDDEPVERVRVAFDSQLKLMPYPNNDFGIVEIIESTANRRIVEIRRSANSNGLGLRFLLTNTSGIGEIRLPDIDVVGANVESEWIANYVSRTLLYDRLNRDAPDIARSDFAAAWGETNPTNVPDFVVERERSSTESGDSDAVITDDESGAAAAGSDLATTGETAIAPWGIKTYPRESRSMAEYPLLTVTYDLNGAEVEYQADVSPVEDLPFQHRLSAPKELEINNVSVKVAGETVPIRWTQSDSGEIHVFVFNATTGTHRIDVQGRLRQPAGDSNDPLALPVIALEDCELTGVELEIRRHPTAGVSLIDSNLIDSNPLNNETDKLLIATLQGDGLTPIEATLRIRKNQPIIKSQILTTLMRDETTWVSEIDYVCEFSGGIPDSLRFRIPAGWADKIQFDDALSAAYVPSSGGNLQLVVYPQLDENSNSWRFTMTVPLEAPQRAAMPVVLPLGNAGVERWLTLPTQIESDQVAWDLRGTEQVDLPDTFTQRSNTQSFRLLNDQSSAELRRIESPAATPNVLSEQIDIAIGDHGYHGTVSWELDPGGTRYATLIVPTPCELVAVAVDGQMTSVNLMASTNDDSSSKQYRVELGGMRLAQQLEAVFSGQSKKVENGTSWQIPRLQANDTHDRFWNVTMPSRTTTDGPPRFAATTDRITQEEHERATLSALMRAVQSPAQDTADYSPDELSAWFSRWRDRITASTDNLPAESLSLDDAAPDAKSAEQMSKAQIIDKLRATTFRLGIADEISMLDELRNRTSTFPTKSESDDTSMTMKLPSRRIFLKSNADELIIAEPRFGADFLQRLLTSASLIACFAVAIRLIAMPSWRGMALRWCHALMALAGIAWMTWLRFPIIGGLLVAASLWWALSPGRWMANATSDGEASELGEPR